MPPKKNPLGLNPLQLKTLALLQALARLQPPDPGGGARIDRLPQPHGDHFHLGPALVASKDATGLSNPAVWAVLERKGLLGDTDFPFAATLTAAGLVYDVGPAAQILHGSDH